MRRTAKRMLVLAVEVTNPELNVLASELIGEDALVVMAEKVPESIDEEVTYVVASYRIDGLNLRPSVLFGDISTLGQAQAVFEETQRTS